MSAGRRARAMDVVQQIRFMSSDRLAAEAVAAFAAAEVAAAEVQHAKDMYGAGWNVGEVIRMLNARVAATERERDEARERLDAMTEPGKARRLRP